MPPAPPSATGERLCASDAPEPHAWVLTPRACLDRLGAALRPVCGRQARAEAEWLLADLLGSDRLALYLSKEPISEIQARRLAAALERRLTGEPMAYVLGRTVFYGHTLQVTPAVLIPRPETEILVQEAVAWARRRLERRPDAPPPLIADLGTGSGAIAASLALEVAACAIVAVELSCEAVRVAAANLARLGLSARVWAVRSDWTEGLRGPVDLIISNPPYVCTEDLSSLPADVRHEPRLGLDGGADGLQLHRRLFADAPRLLADDGAVIVECAEAQAAPLRRMALDARWARAARVVPDLAGRPRALVIERLAGG